MKTDNDVIKVDFSNGDPYPHERRALRLTRKGKYALGITATALVVGSAIYTGTAVRSAEKKAFVSNMELVTNQMPGDITLSAGAHGRQAPVISENDGGDTSPNITYTVPTGKKLVIRNAYELQNDGDTWIVVPNTATTPSPNLDPSSITYFDLTQLGEQSLAYADGNTSDVSGLQTVSVNSAGIVTGLDGYHPAQVSAVLSSVNNS